MDSLSHIRPLSLQPAIDGDPVDFKASKSKILALLRSNNALQQAMPLKALTMDELWDDVRMHMHGGYSA
jgi:hypothetical protein